MIEFPSSTEVHRRLPKEAFYKHLTLTTALKEKFIADVDRITVENSFTKDTLNLSDESEIKEILLLSVTLKKQEFDGKVIEAIARQNPHKLVFLLIYENMRQIALYHGKLYRSPWITENDIELTAKGTTLNEIWDGFTEQTALSEERADNTSGLSVNERLALQEKITKLEKLIEKTEAAAWKEQQPKKKFEIFTKLKKYRQELETLKNVN